MTMVDPDFSAALARLRAAGAQQFDPVRLHYLHTLAERAALQPPAVQRLVQARLAQALADFSARMAQSGTQPTPAPQPPAPPGDTLASLTRRLNQHSQAIAPSAGMQPPGTRPELRSVRQFQNTWSRLSVDRQVKQALHKAPDQAGPINSHLLVLRSLTLMRDIAPDYLNRFMSYVDTLLCLDPGEKKKPAPARDSADGDNAKKTRSRRKTAR